MRAVAETHGGSVELGEREGGGARFVVLPLPPDHASGREPPSDAGRCPADCRRVTGTFINVAAVLAGTAIGLLVGGRLPESARQRVLAGLGLITLVVGVDLALAWRDTDPLYVLGGVLLGGLVGEAIGIEAWLGRLGDRIQAAVSRGEHSRVSEAFVTASLLFCVGPLTVVGSIQDGLTGDYDALATKSMLDGFASIALTATLGWGVALAAGHGAGGPGRPVAGRRRCSRTCSRARRSTRSRAPAAS